MTLADVFEQKREALRVEDVARILDISVKQIYKMAANGQIPSMKIANCVRFDPHDVAAWLRSQSHTNPLLTVSVTSGGDLSRRNEQALNRARRIASNAPQLRKEAGILR